MARPSRPTTDVPARSPRHRGQIRVGIGGWTFAPWRDNFYPAGLAQRLELEFASRHVSAIEVNGTFYRAQKPAAYAKWRAQTPDGFVFSLKAPRYATNRAQLSSAGKSIDAFVHGGIAELGDRLGPINWQLPPQKAFDADDVAAFLDLLPPSLDGQRLRHVVEVRHASFACAEYLELARQRGVASVFTDSPDYPSFADLSSDFVYLRLMRSQASSATGYAPKALDAWSARAQAWASGGEPNDLPRIGAPLPPTAPRDVFVYFISAAKERNPAAAVALLAHL